MTDTAPDCTDRPETNANPEPVKPCCQRLARSQSGWCWLASGHLGPCQGRVTLYEPGELGPQRAVEMRWGK